MKGQIFVVDGDELHALSEKEYEAEARLQERMSALGLSFPDDPTSSRQPQRSLPASDHEEWWKAFEETFQWLLEEEG